LWRRTGGISLKDAGVEPTIFLCSSTETHCGTDEINVVETIVLVELGSPNFAVSDWFKMKSETAAYLISFNGDQTLLVKSVHHELNGSLWLSKISDK
jgi:hypothetical protein